MVSSGIGYEKLETPVCMCILQLNNMNWSLCALPADGHGDDDRLPARVEEFSGGRDLPGYQHPQGAQRHKHSTHQRADVVIVCVGRREGGFTHQAKSVDNVLGQDQAVCLTCDYLMALFLQCYSFNNII